MRPPLATGGVRPRPFPADGSSGALGSTGHGPRRGVAGGPAPATRTARTEKGFQAGLRVPAPVPLRVRSTGRVRGAPGSLLTLRLPSCSAETGPGGEGLVSSGHAGRGAAAGPGRIGWCPQPPALLRQEGGTTGLARESPAAVPGAPASVRRCAVSAWPLALPAHLRVRACLPGAPGLGGACTRLPPWLLPRGRASPVTRPSSAGAHKRPASLREARPPSLPQPPLTDWR